MIRRKKHSLSSRYVELESRPNCLLSFELFEKWCLLRLNEPGYYVIDNYHRQVVGQTKGGGHFTTIGAYDQRNKLVLMNEVHTTDYPPHWVSAELFYRAIMTPTSAQGMYRGIIEVWTKG